jgi:hypothetical protein
MGESPFLFRVLVARLAVTSPRLEPAPPNIVQTTVASRFTHRQIRLANNLAATGKNTGLPPRAAPKIECASSDCRQKHIESRHVSAPDTLDSFDSRIIRSRRPGRVQSASQKYSSCAARTGVGFVLVKRRIANPP